MALLRQATCPELKGQHRSSFLDSSDMLGDMETRERVPKSRSRNKRTRTTSWTTLALSLTNKGGNSSYSPGSPKTRKPSIALLSDQLSQREMAPVPVPVQIRSQAPPPAASAGVDDYKRDRVNVNLDSLFSGRCYDPEPVDISDQYESPDWKPVAISEESVEVSDGNDSVLFNTSHEHQGFYHRELSREAACHMFERFGGEPGLCVVRDSTRTPGHYTLTVWNGKAVVNYRIEFSVRNSQGHYLLSGSTPFRSIGEILLFLLQNQHFFPTAPTHYIPRIPDSARDFLYSKLFVPDQVPCHSRSATA